MRHRTRTSRCYRAVPSLKSDNPSLRVAQRRSNLPKVCSVEKGRLQGKQRLAVYGQEQSVDTLYRDSLFSV